MAVRAMPVTMRLTMGAGPKIGILLMGMATRKIVHAMDAMGRNWAPNYPAGYDHKLDDLEKSSQNQERSSSRPPSAGPVKQPGADNWAKAPPRTAEDLRKTAKFRRQQAVRDRRALKAHTKKELEELRGVFPTRVAMKRYPVPELGTVFEELTASATQLLEEKYKEITEGFDGCPVCKALKFLHPRSVPIKYYRFVRAGGDERLFERAFEVFLVPVKTERLRSLPRPGQNGARSGNAFRNVDWQMGLIAGRGCPFGLEVVWGDAHPGLARPDDLWGRGGLIAGR
jgi:hypothetical protein